MNNKNKEKYEQNTILNIYIQMIIKYEYKQ